jgi:hypothetical protein
MKKFNLRIFIISSLVIGLLTFISIMAEWAVEDNSPGIGLFWIILAKSFWVFSFPINLWLLIFKFNFNASFILVLLILNSFLVGLFIERLFYLRKKKSKIPPVPTGI